MRVHTGVMAAPVAYTVKGKQYISVLAGWGGSFSLIGGNSSGTMGTPGRLLTFGVDGKAALPAPPPLRRFPRRWRLTPIRRR
jgi:quinohemoprotein ethanol dehydrogenase